MNLAKTAFAASVALFVGLALALYWQTSGDRGQIGPPLVVYCAEALRVPMEAIAKDFERDTSQLIELRYEASQTILVQLEQTKQGDLPSVEPVDPRHPGGRRSGEKR